MIFMDHPVAVEALKDQPIKTVFYKDEIKVGVPFIAYTLDNKTEGVPYLKFKDTMKLQINVKKFEGVPKIHVKVNKDLKIANVQKCHTDEQKKRCDFVDMLDKHLLE